LNGSRNRDCCGRRVTGGSEPREIRIDWKIGTLDCRIFNMDRVELSIRAVGGIEIESGQTAAVSCFVE
jgi:hypothetical protein